MKTRSMTKKRKNSFSAADPPPKRKRKQRAGEEEELQKRDTRQATQEAQQLNSPLLPSNRSLEGKKRSRDETSGEEADIGSTSGRTKMMKMLDGTAAMVLENGASEEKSAETMPAAAPADLRVDNADVVSSEHATISKGCSSLAQETAQTVPKLLEQAVLGQGGSPTPMATGEAPECDHLDDHLNDTLDDTLFGERFLSEEELEKLKSVEKKLIRRDEEERRKETERQEATSIHKTANGLALPKLIPKPKKLVEDATQPMVAASIDTAATAGSSIDIPALEDRPTMNTSAAAQASVKTASLAHCQTASPDQPRDVSHNNEISVSSERESGQIKEPIHSPPQGNKEQPSTRLSLGSALRMELALQQEELDYSPSQGNQNQPPIRLSLGSALREELALQQEAAESPTDPEPGASEQDDPQSHDVHSELQQELQMLKDKRQELAARYQALPLLQRRSVYKTGTIDRFHCAAILQPYAPDMELSCDELCPRAKHYWKRVEEADAVLMKVSDTEPLTNEQEGQVRQFLRAGTRALTHAEKLFNSIEDTTPKARTMSEPIITLGWNQMCLKVKNYAQELFDAARYADNMLVLMRGVDQYILAYEGTREYFDVDVPPPRGPRKPQAYNKPSPDDPETTTSANETHPGKRNLPNEGTDNETRLPHDSQSGTAASKNTNTALSTAPLDGNVGEAAPTMNPTGAQGDGTSPPPGARSVLDEGDAGAEILLDRFSTFYRNKPESESLDCELWAALHGHTGDDGREFAKPGKTHEAPIETFKRPNARRARPQSSEEGEEGPTMRVKPAESHTEDLKMLNSDRTNPRVGTNDAGVNRHNRNDEKSDKRYTTFDALVESFKKPNASGTSPQGTTTDVGTGEQQQQKQLPRSCSSFDDQDHWGR